MVVTASSLGRQSGRQSKSSTLSIDMLPRMTIRRRARAPRRAQAACCRVTLANNFLNEIFDGGQSCHQAVLVNDDGHGMIFLAHLAQQLRAGLVSGMNMMDG